jgi:D-alanine-D-alanine ligase
MTATPFNPAALGKVAVLMGGISAEREISLLSGAGVLSALKSQGVDAHVFDIAWRELSDLSRFGFDRCFIALHGRYGEDGTIQGALEIMKIPYTGSGVLASAIAIDKVMTKRLWMADGLPTPAYAAFRYDADSAGTHLSEAAQTLGLPMIIKPPHEGSSIGVTKVINEVDLAAAAALSAGHDPVLLCEECIEGEELTCPILGEGDNAHALPVIRIVAPSGRYDYQNKYFSDDTRYLVPSGLSAEEESEVQRLSLAAYRSLGCRGWGRADLMLRAKDRHIFLLEMNTSPGMTSHSLVPMSAKAAGMSYEQLCVHLLQNAALDATTRHHVTPTVQNGTST